MCEPIDPDKKRTITRLKRMRGQLDGIIRMVEEDRYCVDILTQMSAVQAALAKAGHAVLDKHLQTCVATAIASGDPTERDRVVEELMDVLTRSSGLLR